jgi:hypothetical protein
MFLMLNVEDERILHSNSLHKLSRELGMLRILGNVPIAVLNGGELDDKHVRESFLHGVSPAPPHSVPAYFSPYLQTLGGAIAATLDGKDKGLAGGVADKVLQCEEAGGELEKVSFSIAMADLGGRRGTN